MDTVEIVSQSGPAINWVVILLMAILAIGAMVVLALIMSVVLYFSKKSGESEK